MDMQESDSAIEGYLAVPDSGRGPGVLVLHAWWGLTPFFKQVCDRLAEAGFVALAPDLYHGASTSQIEEAVRLRDSLDRDLANREAQEALAHLGTHEAVSGGLAAMGFSLGCRWACHLAENRPDELAATVLFYGGVGNSFAGTRAAFLGHFAEVDEWAPLDAVEALKADLRGLGRTTSFHIYPGTRHWFFEQDRPDAYDSAAADLAWQRTLAFLAARLNSEERPA